MIVIEMGMMTASSTSAIAVAASVAAAVAILWAWKLLNWVWLRPKKMEKLLRAQGFRGTPYKLFGGNSLDDMKKMMIESTRSQVPPNFLNDKDVAPRVFLLVNHTVRLFGKKSFFWEGQTPKVIITNPEHIKEVFNNNKYFKKERPKFTRVAKLLGSGLPHYEGEQWQRHRKILNPAFHLEKLKLLSLTMLQCCEDMVTKLEEMLSSNGKCDIDLWPLIQNLTCDIISRTSFGSNYEEGKRIFELLKMEGQLVMKLGNLDIPGWWLLPTTNNRRLKEIDREIGESLQAIINKRESAMKAGTEGMERDLLGILLESNLREIKEHGNNKAIGLTSREVIEECNIFYIAGQETTADLLVWTMILLSRFSDWQTRAREEVFQIFGNQKPDHDGLSRLKVVTMILHEVLRLYPPTLFFVRALHKDLNLPNLSLPAGVRVSLPILLIHHDRELWGDDATEFKPERFSEGVANATKGQLCYFPFGWGPRVCIGQNFSLMEVKMILSLMLQRFTFELSPTYTHAPTVMLSLQPRHGANIILHKL